MFPLWFTLLGGSFVFLDVGLSILFLVFSLFWVLWFIYNGQGFINNIQYWMDSQSASQEGNLNSPTWWLVTEFSPQGLLLITIEFYSHNSIEGKAKYRHTTYNLHAFNSHKLFHSEYVCVECRPIYILQHLQAGNYF
jgi:hypothetical protein